jgi:hypothetical protein
LILLKLFIHKNSKQEKLTKKDYSGLIYLLPPIIPLVFYIVLQFFGIGQIRTFIIGILFSLILLYLLTQNSLKEYIKILTKSLTYNLALAIFGIMIFREMFQVSQANIILADLITGTHLPALIIIIIIPLILGVLTGYNLGAIALSYFLVTPFFQYVDINIIGITSIIFISSLVGYLVSPIHLCNVLSSEYLKTDTTRMYKSFIPAVFSLLIIQLIIVIIFFRTV